MKTGKKGLIIAGCIVVLIVIAAIAVLLLFDINSYKSKIEAAASEATGLDVLIAGRMRLSFFPLGIAAKDIRVANGGKEILHLESLKLRVDLISLLKKQLKVSDCELVKPIVTVVKDVRGKFNFERVEDKPAKGRPGKAFSLNDLKLSRGTLVYLNEKTGKKTELKEINLALRDISVSDISPGIIKNISFTGNFDCKILTQKDLRIENLKAPVKAEKGVFSFNPLTMDVFGGKGEGDLRADESGADPAYKINLKVAKLDFEKLQESFGIKRSISGKGDLAASLTIKEKGRRDLLSNLDGTFALRGNNLVTYTTDLDKVVSAYESSQNFNLVDIGVFFIAGPLGSVALKGYRYGNLYYQSLGGQGKITQFISHWKIEKGEAEAVDCALATSHNRIALQGKLNLVSEQYEKVTVAVLDDKGCAIFTQTINGSFGSPRVGTVSWIASLAAPIRSLYRKAKRLVQGGNCKVFYSGSVQQPH